MSTVLSSSYAPSDAKPQLPCSKECGRPSNRQSVLTELEKLLEAIRSRQPGIHSLQARKMEMKFARELSLYFRQLARSVPYNLLPGYLERNPMREAITPDDEAMRIASEVTEGMSARLNGIARKYAESGYLLGATQAHEVIGVEATFALIDDGAIKWMNSHAAEMVTQINSTTRDELATVLTKGSRQGQSVAKLAKAIRTEVSSMADITKGRARMIATTELNNAMSEASLKTYERLDVAGKSWSTVGDDRVSDECRSNEAAGVIPLNGVFPGGVMRPPQHPSCRCTLVPERILQ